MKNDPAVEAVKGLADPDWNDIEKNNAAEIIRAQYAPLMEAAEELEKGLELIFEGYISEEVILDDDVQFACAALAKWNELQPKEETAPK